MRQKLQRDLSFRLFINLPQPYKNMSLWITEGIFALIGKNNSLVHFNLISKQENVSSTHWPFFPAVDPQQPHGDGRFYF